MKGMKQYTTIEQSKKLIELRLDPNTADMCYRVKTWGEKGTSPKYVVTMKENVIIPDKYDIPCWSLTALLELMPDGFSLSNRHKR